MFMCELQTIGNARINLEYAFLEKFHQFQEDRILNPKPYNP